MTLCIWINVEVKLACIGRVLAMPGHASLPLLEDRGDVLAGGCIDGRELDGEVTDKPVGLEMPPGSPRENAGTRLAAPPGDRPRCSSMVFAPARFWAGTPAPVSC
jgi:hypothetical protein